MQISSLSVRNFRALTSVELRNLANSVVIAGPNGCGKSCILDAIRLLKSVYGGYNPNEWQNWFGEFQINLNRHPRELLALFQNRNVPLALSMQIALSDDERNYLRDNAEHLVREQIWQELVPDRRSQWRTAGVPLAAEARAHQPEVERRLAAGLPQFRDELNREFHVAELVVTPDARTSTRPSRLLEFLFSVYDPARIGIIDYHGANRNYNREQLGGINLNIESNEDRLRQHALYNYANKYANLKSEMAATYVRHLLAREANPNAALDDSLTATLKELFGTFFPGKEFLGPKPTTDGKLLFSVRTANGAEHDIDELSSGEKEVLYGYLRLRNSAPRNSVIMIDEPELHLNPRLVRGLASFYHRHLGRSHNNQIWLVTHSDTLIREAVGQSGFSVFHLQPAGIAAGPNQATSVSVADDIERCVIELIGDLAAYTPGAKLVVFEGGGDSEFDVRMTATLFPRFAQLVNSISGGSKRRVADLYDLLETARAAGRFPIRFYSITDADSDAGSPDPPRRNQWNVYHIENYLLEPCFLRKVLDEIAPNREHLRGDQEIYDALRLCAEETIPFLVRHALRLFAHEQLAKCIDLGTDPNRQDCAQALTEAIERSHARVRAAAAQTLTAQALQLREQQLVEHARGALATDEWRSKFRGRDVLKRFVSRSQAGIPYEKYRDLVLARMADAEYQPIGMARVLNAILAHG